MKLSVETFADKKRAILEKVIPHLMNPTSFPMPKLSLDDCAILMAKNEKSMRTKMSVCKCEHTAFEKIKIELCKRGIRRMSDIERA